MQNDKCTEFLQISNKECLFIFQADHQVDELETGSSQEDCIIGGKFSIFHNIKLSFPMKTHKILIGVLQ